MKKLSLFIIILFVWNIGNSQSVTTEAFTVLELFTSEGCSSCPPAEKSTKQIMNLSKFQGKNIVVIEQHVPYWDYLGWKDTYGQAIFETRQRAYCSKIPSQVYTPMWVINGKVATYNPNTAVNHMTNHLNNSSPTTGLKIEFAGYNDDKVSVYYEATGVAKDNFLNIFICENELSTVVTAGENKNKTLEHKYVARTFYQTLLNDMSGKVELDVPSDMNINNSYITAFVQDAISLESLAGTKGFSMRPASINKNESVEKISVYPTIANQVLNIVNHEDHNLLQYEIFNLTGAKVQSGTVNENRIEVHKLDANMYIIRILSNNDIIKTANFIKVN